MGERIRIGLVMKSLQADFFKTMERGAREYAAHHPEIELQIVGTRSQTEVDRQIKLVDELVDSEVDALVVVPINSEALVPPVIRAVSKGIKVVNIDIRLNKTLLEEQHIQIAYLGPDNESAAYDSGKVLASCLHPGDDVLIIEGLNDAENAFQRNKGYNRAIIESNLNLVASESADWETEKAAEVFSSLISQYPKVKGVFCGNDAMALGVINVLERLHRTDIKVCGFDNDPSAQRFLKEGKQVSTIDIYSSQMAVEGIKYAISLLNGKVVKGEVSTKYTLYKSL
jgi:ribose transport system substrate-binding protein